MIRRHSTSLIWAPIAGCCCGAVVALGCVLVHGWFDVQQMVLPWAAAGLISGMPIALYLGSRYTVERLIRVFLFALVPAALLSFVGMLVSIPGGLMIIAYAAWRAKHSD